METGNNPLGSFRAVESRRTFPGLQVTASADQPRSIGSGAMLVRDGSRGQSGQATERHGAVPCCGTEALSVHNTGTRQALYRWYP